MPVTFRLRDLPPGLEWRLREAAESAIEGNWCLTVSRSHVDGQWYLQLDGAQPSRVPLPSTTATVAQLETLLQRLTGEAAPAAAVRAQQDHVAVRKAS